MKRKLVFLLIGLSIVLKGFTQEEIVDQKNERVVCVFDFTNLSSTKREQVAYLQATFADSLALILSESGYKVLDLNTIREIVKTSTKEADGSLSAQNKNAIALSLGADVFVEGFYRVDSAKVSAGIRSYDILSERVAVSVLQSGESGTLVFDTIDTISAIVAEKIKSALKPLTPSELVIKKQKVNVETKVVERVVEIGLPVGIKVESEQEGLEIYFGDSLVGTIKNGVSTFQGKENATINYNLKKEGYWDTNVKIVAKKEAAPRKLPSLYKKTNYSVSLGWATHLPVGFYSELNYYFSPDQFYASLSGGTSFIPPVAESENGYFNAKANAMLNLFLFSKPNDFLRFRAGVGLVSEWLFISDAPLYSVSPALCLGTEFPMPDSSIYAQIFIGVPYISITNYMIQSHYNYVSLGYIWKL